MGDDLFGAREAKQKPESRVVALETHFVNRHRQKWKIEPLLKPYPKHRSLLKGLLDQMGDEELFGLVDLFFETNDWDVKRCDYSIVAFNRLIPHLRLLKVKSGRPMLSPRTEANIDAARRAVKGGGRNGNSGER